MESLRKTMRACFVDHNLKLYLAETSLPHPRKKEVLVKICATAVNRADIMQKERKYNPPEGVTHILGLEGAGEVVDKGSEVTKWNVGDRVLVLLSGGGYADYCTVSEDHIICIPRFMNFIDAAAIPEAWITAYQILFFIGQAKAGETILVHAGASGVGTALIQLAKLNKIRCIVTVGSAEKANFCLGLGAVEACNYKEGPFAEKVLKATEGKGVDILLDCVGGDFVRQNAQVLVIGGRWVFYGVLGGAKVNEDVLSVVLRKHLTIVGTTLRCRPDEYKSKLVSSFVENVMPHFATGFLKPIVDKVFPFMDINEAHGRVSSNKNIGKVVIEVIPDLMEK